MKKLLFLLLIINAFCGFTFADIYYFTGAVDSSWENSSNWTYSSSNANSFSLIGTNATSDLTCDLGSSDTVYQVRVGQDTSSVPTAYHYTLNVNSSGVLTNTDWMNVGSTGTLNINGGTVNTVCFNFDKGEVNINSGLLSVTGDRWYMRYGGKITVNSGGTLSMKRMGADGSYAWAGGNVDLCGGVFMLSGDQTGSIPGLASSNFLTAYGDTDDTRIAATYDSDQNKTIITALQQSATTIQYKFTGANDSNWSNLLNWNPAGVPGNIDFALIGRDATSDLTANLATSSSVKQVQVGRTGTDPTGYIYTLNVNNGGSLNVTDWFTVGETGVLNINGGSVVSTSVNFDSGEVNVNDNGFLQISSGTWYMRYGGKITINDGGTVFLGGTGTDISSGKIDICGGVLMMSGDKIGTFGSLANSNVITAYGDTSDALLDIYYDSNENKTYAEGILLLEGSNCFDAGGDGVSWDDPANWTLGTFPVYHTSDVMLTYIGADGDDANYNVTIDGKAGAGRTWLGIPETDGGSYVLNIEDGADFTLVRMYTGPRGTLNINGGIMSLSECVFQGGGSTCNISGGTLDIKTPAWRIESGTTVNLTGGSLVIHNFGNFSNYSTLDPATGVLYNTLFTGVVDITGGELVMYGNHVQSLYWHVDNGNLTAYSGDPDYHIEAIYDGTYTTVTAAYGMAAFAPSPTDDKIDVNVAASISWRVPPMVVDSTLYLGRLCKGDLSGDYDVDIEDLWMFASGYLCDTAAALDSADFNHDFDVNLTDLSVMADEWNTATVFQQLGTFTNDGSDKVEYTLTTDLEPKSEYVWRVDTQTSEETTTGQEWTFKTTAPQDVYWFCDNYPQIAQGLFDDFDLTLPELADVKQAVDDQNWKLACRRLLDYYKNCDSGSWMRGSVTVDYTPEEAAPILATADAVVDNDTYTFQNITSQVPRTADGGLDWTYRGTNNDVEWAFFNNRFSGRPLSAAYLYTGDPKYLKRINDEYIDWITNNPYTGAQIIPTWRGLEVSFRVMGFIGYHYRYIDDPLLTDAAKLLVLSTLANHANYLKAHHQTGGNWINTEMQGLATIAAAFPELKNSSTWLDYAFSKIEYQMSVQVLPDGVQNELTLTYHRAAKDAFERFALLGREVNTPMDQGYLDKLELMWGYVADTMRPNGCTPLNSDTDRLNVASRIITGADTYNREDWRYIATNGAEGTLPSGEPSRFYPYAGQLISRSGWDADAHWSFFDLGPYGYGGHRHLDKLHFSANAYGRDILVDSGRFGYDGYIADTYRGYAVGTAGHNVVRIAGQNQNVDVEGNSSPQTNDCEITPAYDFAKGTVTGGYTNTEGVAKNTRLVRYERGKYWIIVDRFVTDRARDIEAIWHYHPDCTVINSGLEVTSNDAGLGNIRIVPVGSTNWSLNIVEGQLSPVQGWYSESYGSYESNPTAVYSANITGDTAFAWLIVPGLGTPDQMSAQILSSDATSITIKVTEAPGVENTVTMYY